MMGFRRCRSCRRSRRTRLGSVSNIIVDINRKGKYKNVVPPVSFGTGNCGHLVWPWQAEKGALTKGKSRLIYSGCGFSGGCDPANAVGWLHAERDLLDVRGGELIVA